MKNIFTLLLVSGVLFLASCGNGANTPLPVLPVADTTTYGSYLWFTYANDTFSMHDYALNGIPVIAMHDTITYNTTDSMWECKILVTDARTQQMAMNITAESASDTGAYIVNSNSSTFTDYSEGANKTYSIAIGSVVEITHYTYPITGKMSLGLYYNHNTIYAIDSFGINHN